MEEVICSYPELSVIYDKIALPVIFFFRSERTPAGWRILLFSPGLLTGASSSFNQ